MNETINTIAEALRDEDYTAALEYLLDLSGADGQQIKLAALKAASPDLTTLCGHLNGLEEAIGRFNDEGRYFFSPELLDEIIDTSSLPTYGPEPDDTLGKFSWDAARYLYPDGESWKISSRDDL